jgi:hypothetical protein
MAFSTPFLIRRKSAGKRIVAGIIEVKFSTDSGNTTTYF